MFLLKVNQVEKMHNYPTPLYGILFKFRERKTYQNKHINISIYIQCMITKVIINNLDICVFEKVCCLHVV